MKKQIFLSILILAVIVVAAVFAVKSAQPPQKQTSVAVIPKVNAIRAAAQTISPVISGYGIALPDRTWTAAAPVGGQISQTSRKLKDGEFVSEGDVLVEISAREYELAVQTAEANIAKIEASIEQENKTKENLLKQKGILSQILEVNERNLERQKTLLSKSSVSVTSVENEEVGVLQQKNSIANLESQINLTPAKIKNLEAELTAAKIALERAKLTLSYTVIKAPFEGRIDALNVEDKQFVSAGAVLFKLDSVAMAEITVSISIEQMLLLVGKEASHREDSRPTNAVEKLVIRNNNNAEWVAEFLRLGAEIDSSTRMISVVLGVKNPREHTHPNQPLIKGMFCEALFYARPRSVMSVPRSALHNDNLYIAKPMSEGFELEIRRAKIEYTINNHAVIAAESLKDGEIIILSDVIPAVDGTKIVPVIKDDKK